jgi:hypothetical protein
MAAGPAVTGRSQAERIDALEEEVRALRTALDDLRRQLRSA